MRVSIYCVYVCAAYDPYGDTVSVCVRESSRILVLLLLLLSAFNGRIMEMLLSGGILCEFQEWKERKQSRSFGSSRRHVK